MAIFPQALTIDEMTVQRPACRVELQGVVRPPSAPKLMQYQVFRLGSVSDPARRGPDKVREVQWAVGGPRYFVVDYASPLNETQQAYAHLRATDPQFSDASDDADGGKIMLPTRPIINDIPLTVTFSPPAPAEPEAPLLPAPDALMSDYGPVGMDDITGDLLLDAFEENEAETAAIVQTLSALRLKHLSEQLNVERARLDREHQATGVANPRSASIDRLLGLLTRRGEI